jgi:hypothetical protein
VEAFNVFNHTQFTGINSQTTLGGINDATPTNLPFDANGNLINKTGFGTVSGSRNPRVMQVVARFSF